MSVEENLRIFSEALEAINARDWARFDELHAEAVFAHAPPLPEPTKGRAAHREYVQRYVKAFPDMRVEEVRAFGQDDWVCVEFTASGTHEGPLAGPGGQSIPATNKSIRANVCNVAKFEGGQIVEESEYYDLLGMMAQLGLAP